MKITIKQIAEESGVSVTTVSNVINKKAHRVSADKIKLIESIMKKYNYTPNMNARSLVKSSSRLIGLLYYSENERINFADPFVTEILEGIEKKAKEYGYFTLIHNITSVEDVEAVQMNWKFEGFIAVGVSESFFAAIDHKIQAPVIFIDTHLSEETKQEVKTSKWERCFIHTDDKKVGYQATDYLANCGHEQIGFLSYPFKIDATGVIHSRFEGYKQALAEHGLQYDDRLSFTSFEFEKIVTQLDKITALVVTADFLAVEFIHYLKENHCYDPKHISIIGFDDIRYAKLMDPPLTTIRLDQVRKGELAVDVLASRTTNKETEQEKNFILPGELIERESVMKRT